MGVHDEQANDLYVSVQKALFSLQGVMEDAERSRLEKKPDLFWAQLNKANDLSVDIMADLRLLRRIGIIPSGV